ncbi:hypothetical protein [Ammoniphilus sp. 3BR4]|uniref:hypothetical protein n=1 Tax=Ammoniphilus sp. 3BR4 TaxID=3158265 RepID=UPI003466FA32
MSGNSWEVESYQQGKWRISVRSNPENDRLDEGDFPEGHSASVAGVRGQAIPLREPSEQDEK